MELRYTSNINKTFEAKVSRNVVSNKQNIYMRLEKPVHSGRLKKYYKLDRWSAPIKEL